MVQHFKDIFKIGILTKALFEKGWIPNAQTITISSAKQLMLPQSGQSCFIFVKNREVWLFTEYKTMFWTHN